MKKLDACILFLYTPLGLIHTAEKKESQAQKPVQLMVPQKRDKKVPSHEELLHFPRKTSSPIVLNQDHKVEK